MCASGHGLARFIKLILRPLKGQPKTRSYEEQYFLCTYTRFSVIVDFRTRWGKCKGRPEHQAVARHLFFVARRVTAESSDGNSHFVATLTADGER